MNRLSAADFDVFNTDHLASEVQHGPIVDWFGRKQIKVMANMRGRRYDRIFR
jgi:hypothetical protein